MDFLEVNTQWVKVWRSKLETYQLTIDTAGVDPGDPCGGPDTWKIFQDPPLTLSEPRH